VPFIVILAPMGEGGEGGLAYPRLTPWAKLYRPYRGCSAALRVRHLCNELQLQNNSGDFPMKSR